MKKIKLEPKLYKVKIGMLEDDLEVSGNRNRAVNVVAADALLAIKRVRLSRKSGITEFIDGVEFIDYIDKP